MNTCIICRFEVPQDDQIAPAASGRCVCLRCFSRETGTARPMPKQLMREIEAVIEQAVAEL